jgi:hypothetical protein
VTSELEITPLKEPKPLAQGKLKEYAPGGLPLPMTGIDPFFVNAG